MSYSTSNSRPISYTYVNLHKYKQDAVNYARFLSGNTITDWPSRDLRASSSIALRFSRRYLASSAVAACVTAAFQSAFAAFMCRELRFSAASSKSCNVVSEQSINTPQVSPKTLGSIDVPRTLTIVYVLRQALTEVCS
jgi:hypothetical protein